MLWIRVLHEYGIGILLTSFSPNAEICILFRTARREVRIVRWTLSDISHDHAQNSLIWFPCHIKERENTHD